LHIAVELKKESKEKEQKLDDNKKKNDKEETEPMIVSYIERKRRGSSEIKPFYLGIFDTPLEDLKVESINKSIDGVSSKKENGVLVAKIYKDKPQGDLPTAETLNRAEMIALMHKKDFDPVTISDEEYQEKIYSSFKTVKKYGKNTATIDTARKKLSQLIDEFIKNKEGEDSNDNEKQ